MAILNFFIPPLTPALRTRTRIAHVTRGLCLYISSSGNAMPTHPLTLPMTLGLLTSQHGINFQAASSQPRKLNGLQLQKMFTLLGLYWEGSLAAFNICNCAENLLLPLDMETRLLVLNNAASWLDNSSPLIPKVERLKAMKHSDTLPQDIMARLETCLADLERSLLAKDPMMPQHLRNTHSVLISYPETVHLLEDSEIARIIDAAEIHTKTEIVKAAAAGKSTGGSRKKVTLNDL